MIMTQLERPLETRSGINLTKVEQILEDWAVNALLEIVPTQLIVVRRLNDLIWRHTTEKIDVVFAVKFRQFERIRLPRTLFPFSIERCFKNNNNT